MNLLKSIQTAIEFDSQLSGVERELMIAFYSFSCDEYFAISANDSSENDNLVYQFMGNLDAPLSENWLQFATCLGCDVDDSDEVLFLNSKYRIEEGKTLRVD